MLMTSIDAYRERKAEAEAICANPPTTITKEVFIPDPLTEARYKAKIQELGAAHREIGRLNDELRKLLPPPPPPPPLTGDDDDGVYER
jgi:hypothetical protein